LGGAGCVQFLPALEAVMFDEGCLHRMQIIARCETVPAEKAERGSVVNSSALVPVSITVGG
jgi:hypothetical protein